MVAPCNEDGVVIRYSDTVNSTTVSTWTPIIGCLLGRHHIKWCGPSTRRLNYFELHHVFKFLLSHSKTLWCQTSGVCSNWRALCFYVMRHLSEGRELEVWITRVLWSNRWAGGGLGDVVAKFSLLHVNQQSKCQRKLMPSMGFCTSAMMKINIELIIIMCIATFQVITTPTLWVLGEMTRHIVRPQHRHCCVITGCHLHLLWFGCFWNCCFQKRGWVFHAYIISSNTSFRELSTSTSFSLADSLIFSAMYLTFLLCGRKVPFIGVAAHCRWWLHLLLSPSVIHVGW